ncbi:hypothetical protein E2C01_055944 [Portunus trituberculatus]|uniref:Uncharacterized protein n=1 Tax=Portunus trituberculatus TaxID=210409 RepID=A0A5B7GW26_PORTR|nr:hypothetical protein [Portunus trituberculatus]
MLGLIIMQHKHLLLIPGREASFSLTSVFCFPSGLFYILSASDVPFHRLPSLSFPYILSVPCKPLSSFSRFLCIAPRKLVFPPGAPLTVLWPPSRTAKSSITLRGSPKPVFASSVVKIRSPRRENSYSLVP